MALSGHERIVFGTLLPPGADPRLPQGVLDLGFDAFYADFRRDAPPLIRTGLRIAIASATWLAPVLVAKVPPLARLSVDDRERALEAMGTSRVGLLRQLVVLLKLVAALAYGADARVRDAIGYGGEPAA